LEPNQSGRVFDWRKGSNTADGPHAVIDHLKSSLFELRPETSDIICAEGAIIRRSSMVKVVLEVLWFRCGPEPG